MLLRIRLKLIRWLIGHLSIVANVTLDGSIIAGNGLVLNSNFIATKITPNSNVYCGRINVLPGSTTIIDYNVISNPTHNTYHMTEGQTLADIEEQVKPGDIVYVHH